MGDLSPLWTISELARFLGYAKTTVARMVSTDPAKLPPRVAHLHLPRWNPETVRLWTLQANRAEHRRGRPRQI